MSRMHFSAAVRALAINKLRLSPERLTWSAVKAFILALVDVALLVKPCKYLLNHLIMRLIRSSYILIISNVK